MTDPTSASAAASTPAPARKRALPDSSPTPSPPKPNLRHQTTIRIPFPNAHLASIAATVLAVDRPLKPHEAFAAYAVVHGNVFEMEVQANSIRMLRTTVNANLDQIMSVANTMAQLAPEGMITAES